MSIGRLPVPEFFDSENAGKWGYRPNRALVEASALAMCEKHGCSVSDALRVCLLIVDAQKDFCLPEGTLYVGGRSGRGAIDDNARLARFIYREAARIEKTFASLDTHPPCAIFYPSFWVTNHDVGVVRAHTRIVMKGGYLTNVAPDGTVLWGVALTSFAYTAMNREIWTAGEMVRRYVKLANGVDIWPYHCMQGSDGAALVGVIDEAIFYQSVLREVQPQFVVKGMNASCEQYSIFGPDVDLCGEVGINKDLRLLNAVFSFDAVVVAGQAKSHCVLASLKDMLAFAPFAASKVYVLQDCMSSVVIPDGPDFTDRTEAEYARLAAAGMNLVNSTDPMETWPGVVGECCKK